MNRFSANTYLTEIHQRWDTGTVSPGDWVAAGCSHTAGYGIDQDEIYISHLASHYNKTIHNLALGSGNHQTTRLNVQHWLRSTSNTGLVIAQWPNPIRITSWNNDTGSLVNISNTCPMLSTMLKHSELNLYVNWLDSIISLNQLCNSLNVPIVNLLLEDCAQEYKSILTKFNIVLHIDEKLPGRSWIFDSAASDNLHHSARCHKLWAERLIGIIDEYPTR